MVAELNRLPGVSVVIATTDADGPGSRMAPNDVPADVPMHVFHRNCSERWKVSLGLTSWVSRHALDYDLIHIHAAWSYATAAAARAARRHGVPYIIRPAGMLSPFSWQHGNWTKRLYWNAIERRNVAYAAAIHVTSSAEAGEVRAIQSHAQTYVISNGVEDAAFSAPHECGFLRAECGRIAADKPILLFLSRLHPKKGIVDRLLAALARMKTPCILAIVGGGDPHAPTYEERICKAIQDYHLDQRVIMLGHVAGEKRWALYDSADVFVLPSHSENFGIVVAEAMARGCPVVVTNAVQSCSHVQAARAGEVVSGDVDELAATLDRLLSQPELRNEYGEAGKNYARKNFRWAEIAKHIDAMYRGCLNLR